MSKKELVLIPTPAVGHLLSAVEFAKQLTKADNGFGFSVTILIIKPPHELPAAASKFNYPDIRFIQLPEVDLPPPGFTDCIEKLASVYIEDHKSHVKDAILEHVVSKSIPLAGIIVDMFCTSMIDVANEIGVPFYVFFPSGALFLSFLLYIPIHSDSTGKESFTPSDPDSIIPAFAEPFPSRFLPNFAFSKDGYSTFLYHARNFKQANGIIINTFRELEADTIKSLESDLGKTKIYTVGPLIHRLGEPRILDPKSQKIISWLDEQPSSSVIFLCFGSMGGLQVPQLAEIAIALEKSGQRFVWSIQKPPSNDLNILREYDDFSEVLPDGFLERTENRGLVCGWAPQVDILSHEAVGGFMTHCGWNSILESLWNGVPIAAWPLYAEQHLNAYKLVKELGFAVEVKLDYRMDDANLIVTNDEIAKAITILMDSENPMRKKLKEISDLSRQAILQGGSSFRSMESFVADILAEPL